VDVGEVVDVVLDDVGTVDAAEYGIVGVCRSADEELTSADVINPTVGVGVIGAEVGTVAVDVVAVNNVDVEGTNDGLTGATVVVLDVVGVEIAIVELRVVVDTLYVSIVVELDAEGVRVEITGVGVVAVADVAVVVVAGDNTVDVIGINVVIIVPLLEGDEADNDVADCVFNGITVAVERIVLIIVVVEVVVVVVVVVVGVAGCVVGIGWRLVVVADVDVLVVDK